MNGKEIYILPKKKKKRPSPEKLALCKLGKSGRIFKTKKGIYYLSYKKFQVRFFLNSNLYRVYYPFGSPEQRTYEFRSVRAVKTFFYKNS